MSNQESGRDLVPVRCNSKFGGWVGVIGLLLSSAADGQVGFGPAQTLDVPSHGVEIVQHHAEQNLLIATNAQWKSLDIFEVESLMPLRLHMIDFDPDEAPGPQGVDTIYEPTILLSRTDVRPWVDPQKPDKRRDPESVKRPRFNGRVLAVLTIERGDMLLGLDVTNAATPMLFDTVKVGDRPEGLAITRDEQGIVILTGGEGNWGPGTISATRLQIQN